MQSRCPESAGSAKSPLELASPAQAPARIIRGSPATRTPQPASPPGAQPGRDFLPLSQQQFQRPTFVPDSSVLPFLRSTEDGSHRFQILLPAFVVPRPDSPLSPAPGLRHSSGSDNRSRSAPPP